MWIYIPDRESDKEPWVGQIQIGQAQKGSWSFELVRLVEGGDLYRQNPFDGTCNVIGLYDYQKPCTLIRPIVLHIDPGSLDVKNKSQRTVIKGEFQAILLDIPVTNGDEKLFLGVTFESEAFDAWVSNPSFRKEYNKSTKEHLISSKIADTKEFIVSGIGSFSYTSSAKFQSKTRSTAVNSTTRLKIDFDEPKSLNDLMRICFSLERLFGFLVGFRGRFPDFITWIDNKISLSDSINLNYDGALRFGDVDFLDGSIPHPFECLHLNGLAGAEIEKVIENFFAKEKDIIDRIGAVEFSRFFSKNINDRFSVVIPVFESLIQKR